MTVASDLAGDLRTPIEAALAAAAGDVHQLDPLLDAVAADIAARVADEVTALAADIAADAAAGVHTGQ